MNIKEPIPTREAVSMSYSSELTRAMTWLGQQDNTIFLGQSIAYTGNSMYKTLVDVPDDKKIELPVAEEMQLGMSLGLSLAGKIPISIFPRFDFLLCATNQLVNHLDKLEDFTHNQYQSHVIIRVGIGSKSPMYPGVQHCSDYTKVFRKLLKRVKVVLLLSPQDIMETYQTAYYNSGSYLIIENMEAYNR